MGFKDFVRIDPSLQAENLRLKARVLEQLGHVFLERGIQLGRPQQLLLGPVLLPNLEQRFSQAEGRTGQLLADF